MKRLFSKLKESVEGSFLDRGLARTRAKLAGSVHRVLAGRRVIDEAVFEDLEEILITSDVGVGAAGKLLEGLRRRVKDERLETGEAVEAALVEEIVSVLRGAESVVPETEAAGGPWVVLVIGVNGTGKTTTLGKLAHYYRSRGKTVLLAAADTFRAAAVEQLRIWADRTGAEVVAGASGADPAAVAFDAVAAAAARNVDVVLIDTAGRLQTKANLMEELGKIGRVVKKRIPAAPHEVLLVLDANTGQNAVIQARQFGAVAGTTGLVLTKLDGTAKGGVVIAIAGELGVPVRFLGVGEGIEDLAPFNAETFAAALFSAS
jgi:fused signal recognition particle receptor